MRKCCRQKSVVLVLGLGMFVGGYSAVCFAALTAAQTKDKAKEPPKDVVDEKAIRQLIQQLGDDSFDVRETADKKLAAVGEPALALLRMAAKDNPDAEVRQRATDLVRAINAQLFSQVRQLAGHAGKRQAWVTNVVVTPDGSQAYSVGFDDDVRLWDLAAGQQILAFGAPKAAYWYLALSKDGKRLIAAGEEKTALVFDAKTGKQLQQLIGHTAELGGVAFLADGKQVVTGGWDQSIRVWDVETGKEIRKFAGVTDCIRCLAISPDGKLLVAGHSGKKDKKTPAGPPSIRIWDLDKGQEIRALKGHTNEIISISFSPDGKTVLSSSNDKTVRLWDVASGKEQNCLRGHTHNVTWASFTPDGKSILSCGNQTNPWIGLWDVATGNQIYRSGEVPAGFYCVAGLPDNRQCVTAGKDGIVRMWQWKR